METPEGNGICAGQRARVILLLQYVPDVRHISMNRRRRQVLDLGDPGQDVRHRTPDERKPRIVWRQKSKRPWHTRARSFLTEGRRRRSAW